MLRFNRLRAHAAACLSALCLAATSLVPGAGLSLAPSMAQAQSGSDPKTAQALITGELEHIFGLLGPLPLDAASVTEDAGGGVLAQVTIFGRPVGTLAVDVAPSGDGLWTVASRDWRAGENLDANVGAASDSWQLQGLWDQRIRGYRQLDYRVQGLTLRTAQGGEFNIDELSMVADPAGYRVQVRGLRVSGGTAPANEGDPDTSAGFTIGELRYQSQWQGGAPGSAYASLGRAFDYRFLKAIGDGGEALIAATMAHLQALYLPASASRSDLEIRDLGLSVGALGLTVQIDRMTLPAGSEGDALKAQDLQLTMDGLEIQRREDFASLNQAQLSLNLAEADVAAFTGALATLFTEAEPGSSWSVLADIFLFFSSLQVEGSVSGMVFTLPDRLFSLTMAEAAGSLQLRDMRLDGAGVTLQVRADGIDLSALPSEAGTEPDPIVVPAVVPVLGGRLVRFDPLSQSLVPSQLSTTVDITALPMANLRETLGSLPRAGSVQDPRTLLRSLATGVLGMITPFLIQPPMVAVSDTVATAEDFSMSLEGTHQVMPIPPLFGFGSFVANISGLDAVSRRAEQTAADAEASGGEDAQGMQEYGRQIAGWASRMGDFGAASGNDQRRYALELTQLGEIILNGDIIAPQ
ncbi:MAG: hypothetical protein CME00_03610 [Geminicoccus sp.]|nr:hypothetical protein [Geminicoccus sp.]HCI00271.1 hypothetical protein [Alphaproteobacteria bacterium]